MSNSVSDGASVEAITVRNVSFEYQASIPIITQCTLAVRRGRILALLGPNGSGKTTLLKLIAGALMPSSGEVSRVGRVGYVPQFLQLSFAYSVLDIVLMGRARQIGIFATPSERDVDAAISALKRVEMEEFAARSFDELSGGERQLVALARALAADADILVLDEPTSALDLRHQELVLQWMRRLAHKEELTIVFSTHHPQHADAIADDVALIHSADRIVLGSAHEMLSAQAVGELFGVDMRRVAADGALKRGGALVTEWRV